jgi:hypothetical protein
MEINNYTFNWIEFFFSILVALSIWLIDKLPKPNIKVEVGNISLMKEKGLKTLNLKLINKKKIPSIFDRTATQVRIYLYFLDYPSQSEFNKIIARWNNSKEPVTPDYKNIDIGLALTNPREVLVPGQEEEISIVMRGNNDTFCYPFNNESYIHYEKNYFKPEWKITDKKFIVKVEMQSAEIQKVLGYFLVLNKATLEQFKITKIEID